MDLKLLLASVRRYWTTFTVVAAAVLAMGLTGLLLTPIQYVSTTQLLVAINGSTTATAYQNDDLVAERVHSYIALLTTDVVSQRVIDRLGLTMTPRELAAKISATNVPPNTSIIDIAVSDKSPEQARRLADALGAEFVGYTDALETPTGEDGQKVHTTVVTAAGEPTARVGARVVLGTLIALAAVILGTVAVWIRSLSDPVVRTAHRAGIAAGVPVLGCVTSSGVDSVATLDAYRRLRARLQLMASTQERNIWMLTSVDEVDITEIASSLARAAGLAGRRAIVLNADVAEPRIGEPEPRDAAAARSESAESDGNNPADIDSAHRHGAIPDSLFVSTGAEEPDRVATNATATLIERLLLDHELVVIATPPVLSAYTASLLSECVDAVLVVVQAETTIRRDLTRTVKVLEATGAPLKGVVILSQDRQGQFDEHPRRGVFTSRTTQSSTTQSSTARTHGRHQMSSSEAE
jgi:capsular polysaccharide biosynthesis protein